MGAQLNSRDLDRVIARLAERQHGVVSRAQLVGMGLGRYAIGHRLECGRFHALHRGVYAVGHSAVSREGRWMAAVLVTGPGAALSHRSAATIWGVHVSTRTRVEVTAERQCTSRPGVEVHRSRLSPDEVTAVDGIPVTTVPRTLLDLATVLGRREVARAANEAEARQLADPLSLGDLVARYPRRRGIATIKAILADGRIGATVTRSELEGRFLAFLGDAGLPRPEVNVSLQLRGNWIEVDCLWRGQRLVIELDGMATHGTAASFVGDRSRDRVLQSAGWRVVRITWRQLHDEPDVVEADLRTLLSAA